MYSVPEESVGPGAASSIPDVSSPRAAHQRMGRVLRRLTSNVAHLALPETYEDTLRALRLRGWATLAALLVACTLVAGGAATHVTRAWAVPCSTLVALWAATEVAFYWLYYIPRYRELNAQPAIHAPPRLEAGKIFARFLAVQEQLPSRVDARAYLALWFMGAPYEEVRRGNLEDLVAYGFHYRSREQMVAEGLAEELEQQVAAMEAAFGIQLPPGHNPQLRFMSHLWDDLRVMWRPLAFYVVWGFVGWMSGMVMRGFGFRIMRQGHLPLYVFGVPYPDSRPSAASAAATPPAASSPASPATDSTAAAAEAPTGHPPPPPPADSPSCKAGKWYSAAATLLGGRVWLRQAPPRGSDDSDTRPLRTTAAGTPHASVLTRLGAAGGGDAAVASVPVLFLHGVGGLPLYVELIKSVAALGNPVIAVEFGNVSLRLVTRAAVPTVEESTEAVVRALDALGVDQVAVVAHSFGTFIASRLIQAHRRRVQSVVLIDPVCFGMFIPQLLHSFVYRSPRFNKLNLLWRDLILYFASRDLQVAATFGRRFYWSDVNLWPDQLPPHSVVLLSGADDLMASEVVRDALRAAPDVTVVFNPHLFHGALLFSPAAQRRLLGELSALLTWRLPHAVARTLTSVLGPPLGRWALPNASPGHTSPPARCAPRTLSLAGTAMPSPAPSSQTHPHHHTATSPPGSSATQHAASGMASDRIKRPHRRWTWGGPWSGAPASFAPGPAVPVVPAAALSPAAEAAAGAGPGGTASDDGQEEDGYIDLVRELRRQIAQGQASDVVA